VSRAIGLLDPPSQRQGALTVAQRQHQHLVAVRHFGLIQDQDKGLAIGGCPLQDLARKRLHDVVTDHQGIAKQPADPLVAHIGAVRLPRQPGSQIHQVGAAHVEHRRNQKRQFCPLGLTLFRQATLEFRAEAIRNFLDAVHDAFPGSAKSGILESHTGSSRQ
jgi:hypothetical protein